MSARYLGGIVSKDPLTLNPAAGNAANGVFTLEQYMQAVKNATWPGFDPYFNRTVLSLHGNGTNGAQNNTFLDGSTNNFTITRNGNTTQGTFSPFSLSDGYWSNFFDGSGDFLTAPSNSSVSGTGAFTFEFFVYMSATQSTTRIFTGGTGCLSVSLGSAGSLSWGASNISDFFTVALGSILNQWAHIVIARNSSGSVRSWFNGASVTTGTDTYSYSSNNVHIGRSNLGSGQLTGYLSNFRLVEADVYGISNSSITVPTTPLTAVANTKLLTCQSNRFVDNSTNAFAITRNGDTRVTPFSPFAPSAAYSAGTNGGSGYFDGTGDFLTVPDNAAFDLSGDFTIEFVAYATGANNRRFLQLGDYRSANNGLVIYTNVSNALVVYVNGATIITGSAFPLNQWVYVALVRSGVGSNNLKLYMNAVQDGQATNTVSFTGVAGNGVAIGAEYGGSYAATAECYISTVRIVNGTALTPAIPTSPLTAITNTSLLLNFTNAGIFDNTGKNNLETVGNAQIDTTTKKFGTGSMEFDGTGDYLAALMNPDLVFGSGDMTIELWIYPNTISGTDTIFDTRTSGAYGTNSFSLQLESGVLKAYAGSASGELILAGTTAVSTGAWTHIAFTRASGTNRIFVNGTQQASNSTSWNQTFTSTNQYYIGQTIGFDRPFDGFIDDLRITKGVARYTANFTPQTSQWQDQ